MSRQQYDPRPYIAALLGSLLTGLGHVYLGRWKRAVGWFALLVWSSAVFVGPQTSQPLASGGLTGSLSMVPLFLISIMSIVDVFLVARRDRLSATTDSEPSFEACPDCGRDLDPAVDFCPWCGADRPAERTA
ncbi:zinc ribbon domain-containing protein [Halorhabdus salina]|uniref:zinc ribbon domain-containing protein n=1 Tax=Halorhabdus salina TaxID=2750670 RepID=UPI0015EF6E5C|nr:zinc ribbon domain-containing protein [Halorhabdus salina]